MRPPVKIDESLHKVADAGDLVKVMKLVENLGFDLNLVDRIGETPLQKAARGGKGSTPVVESPDYLGIVKYLLEKGAIVGLNNALDLAISFGQFEIAKHLISIGVKPYNEQKAVSNASEKGEEMLRLVLTVANIDAQNGYGNTALHDQVSSNRIDTVKLLLASGANRKIKNDCRQTPAAIAVSRDFEEILLLLVVK